MAGDQDKELENHKAQLRRQEMHWQAQFSTVESSDRAAVDLGLAALKTAVLINAGAIVALLAFIGQQWSDPTASPKILLHCMLPFVWGLVAAAFATGAAYFYQSFVTLRAHHELLKISEGAEKFKSTKWVPRSTAATGIFMVTLAVGSFILFVYGVLSVIRTLAP